MPELRNDLPYFTMAPDWVCEVLSPTTAGRDRIEKLPIYRTNQVKHAWLIDPLVRSLEVFRLENERWTLLGAYGGHDKARAEPFDAIELDLALLWQDVTLV